MFDYIQTTVTSNHDESLSEDEEMDLNSLEVTIKPERRLVISILLRAVRDLAKNKKRELRRLTIYWFYEPDESATGDFKFTYRQCCDYLDLHPEILLKILEKEWLLKT